MIVASLQLLGMFVEALQLFGVVVVLAVVAVFAVVAVMLWSW
jgi:hypothetical protein